MTQRTNKRYSQEEKQTILSNYKELTVRELAVLLGRSERSVRAQIERMGLSLRKLKRNAPFEWTDSKIEFLKDQYKSHSDKKIGEMLGASQGIVYRKREELGLTIITRKPFIQAGYYRQYVDGKRVWTHRYEAEKKIGRKLKPSEPVHHIDGDKLNNNHENLYVCKDKSDHGKVHASLEEAAFSLYKLGVIKFDEEKGEYYHTLPIRTEGWA